MKQSKLKYLKPNQSGPRTARKGGGQRLSGGKRTSMSLANPKGKLRNVGR